MRSSHTHRRHRLDLTLEDVAALAGVSMHTIYADIKRGRLDKNSLVSVIEYVKNKEKDLPYEMVKGNPEGFLL